MRQSFLKRILNKPPFLFPWVALFHIVMLAYTIWNYSTEPISLIWLQVLWMIMYTVSWLFVCDMKRWAALVYLGLTTLNLGLVFMAGNDLNNDFTSSLFPIDILFTFFLMFYYKRFE